MAHVAKAQLLRTLIVASALAGFTAHASEPDGEPPVDFAPNATGHIRAPIEKIVRDAEKRGDALADVLKIQPPKEDVEIVDLEGIRARALTDPPACEHF